MYNSTFERLDLVPLIERVDGDVQLYSISFPKSAFMSLIFLVEPGGGTGSQREEMNCQGKPRFCHK